MKKHILMIFISFFMFTAFAQQYATVDLGDDVYSFLIIAQEKGYCERLSNVKPYTQKYVITLLNEIKDNLYSKHRESKFYDSEMETVQFYLDRYYKQEGIDFNRMSYRKEDDNNGFPLSFEFNNTFETFVSSGVYTDSKLNSTGFEVFNNFNFLGDIGKNFSYRSTGYMGITQMPLQQVGEDYFIGYWWYDDWRDTKEGRDENGAGDYLAIRDPSGEKREITERTINTFRNNSVLPYSYKKKWDGSVYYLSFLNANGLEGWPDNPSLSFGMFGELRTSFANDRINIGVARINREWAAMDYGSSLVLNQNASPFIGVDASVKILDWLSFSTITGVLEFPNQRYVNEKAWYMRKEGRVEDCAAAEPVEEDKKYSVVDSYFFQNFFSMGLFELDLKYLHFDFGSGCIWPKRFELGYMFPLIDRVVYQNSVGDYDNLSLYGDIKGIWPGVGSIWASAYLEELNAFNTKLFEKTRAMFAFQFGSKVNLPFLPYSTLSARYTKVEPYCYTHQAIRKQPWYADYISESYTNNGRPLGYYLDPNSDEIFVRFDTKPKRASSVALQYQLVRHGADYGSGQIDGSSLYSEMPTGIRDTLYKYFLHDGVYEWSNIIKLEGSYNFNTMRFPAQVTCSIGYLYDYFTQNRDITDTSLSPYAKKTKSPYHKINTAEYPIKQGFVFSININLFAFDMCK